MSAVPHHRVSFSRITRGLRAARKGKTREGWAAFLLFLKGYRILGRRRRTPFGEVDILAQKGRTLVAVEVKARGGEAAAKAALSITQQRRLRAALSHLAARYPLCRHLRCDVVLFTPWPRHIRNAFGE